MLRSRTRAQARAAAAARLLLDLPDDLLQHTALRFLDPMDCAALRLALPPRIRPFLATRQFFSSAGCHTILYDIALALLSGARRVDEALLRQYARHADATVEGCHMLAHWSWWADTSCRIAKSQLIIVCHVEYSSNDDPFDRAWFLHRPQRACSGTRGPMLRATMEGGMVKHYAGRKGAERVVRAVLPAHQAAHLPAHSAQRQPLVSHFRGRKGAERLVRAEHGDGRVQYYDGPGNAERLVRLELPCGWVEHYVGHRGAERLVRAEHADGSVQHYDGPGDAERLVRLELPCGRVQHYVGPGDAERLVRAEHADGRVRHYDGPRGAERLVRLKLPCGKVRHYDGPRDAERCTHTELPDGRVWLVARVAHAVAPDAEDVQEVQAEVAHAAHAVATDAEDVQEVQAEVAGANTTCTTSSLV